MCPVCRKQDRRKLTLIHPYIEFREVDEETPTTISIKPEPTGDIHNPIVIDDDEEISQDVVIVEGTTPEDTTKLRAELASCRQTIQLERTTHKRLSENLAAIQVRNNLPIY